MQKDKVDQLLQERGKFSARQGGWLAGKGVFSHGRDLLREMMPHKRYFHVLMLNALGEVPEDRLVAWVEATYVCMSWPDPRIWCNGIGALAGSAETTAAAATVAGVLASDSAMYGPYTMRKSVPYIQYALTEMNDGLTVEEFVAREVKKTGGKVHMMGFARPIATGDERVEALMDYADTLGFEQGPHLRLALEIEAYLLEHYGESLNIAGYAGAFLADYGLDGEQAYSLYPVVVNSGVTACYLQQREKPEDSFLPLTCNDIDYTGPARRRLQQG